MPVRVLGSTDRPRNGRLTSRDSQQTKRLSLCSSARRTLSRWERPNSIWGKTSRWRLYQSPPHPPQPLLFPSRLALHLTNPLRPRAQQLMVSLSTTSRSLTIYSKRRRSYNRKRQFKSFESQNEVFPAARISQMQSTQRSNESCDLCTKFDSFECIEAQVTYKKLL